MLKYLSLDKMSSGSICSICNNTITSVILLPKRKLYIYYLNTNYIYYNY